MLVTSGLFVMIYGIDNEKRYDRYVDPRLYVIPFALDILITLIVMFLFMSDMSSEMFFILTGFMIYCAFSIYFILAGFNVTTIKKVYYFILALTHVLIFLPCLQIEAVLPPQQLQLPV